jgi:chromatin remodeling complex protein RSC6
MERAARQTGLIHVNFAAGRALEPLLRLPRLESLALLARLGLISVETQEGTSMAKGTSGGGAKGGLQRPVTPSADLAAITGSDPLPRSQVVSKMWDHIRKNNLQNPANKREILADDKLKKVFGGKDKVSMFEMNKHLSNHLK